MEYLIYNLKEYTLKHIITLSMDFYSNNSFREVLEVIILGEQYIYFINSLIFDLIPSAINIITFVVYFLYFINTYIGLIIIDIIVIYI